jgi:hypothetical protein
MPELFLDDEQGEVLHLIVDHELGDQRCLPAPLRPLRSATFPSMASGFWSRARSIAELWRYEAFARQYERLNDPCDHAIAVTEGMHRDDVEVRHRRSHDDVGSGVAAAGVRPE